MKSIVLKDFLYIVDLYQNIDLTISCDEYSIYNVKGFYNDIENNFHDLVKQDFIYIDFISIENDNLVIKAWIQEVDLIDFINENKTRSRGLDL